MKNSEFEQAFKIKVCEHDFVKERWEEVETTIRRVFAYSKFNDNRDVNRPLDWTWASLTNPAKEGLKHVLALNKEDRIIGALFGVATQRREGEEEHGNGWFFVDQPTSEMRRKVGDAIYNKAICLLRDAGFKRIVTNVGTKAGEKFLSKRFGYKYEPTKDKNNRWVKIL